MTDQQLREARRYLEHDNRRYPSGRFVEVPREQWPKTYTTAPLKNVFRSREFLVQVFGGETPRLSICRAQVDDHGRWTDGISWEELQDAKNACGFEDQDAVEAFPKKSDVVNVANMRHLWIVPRESVPFIWRGGKPPVEQRKEERDL